MRVKHWSAQPPPRPRQRHNGYCAPLLQKRIAITVRLVSRFLTSKCVNGWPNYNSRPPMLSIRLHEEACQWKPASGSTVMPYSYVAKTSTCPKCHLSDATQRLPDKCTQRNCYSEASGPSNRCQDHWDECHVPLPGCRNKVVEYGQYCEHHTCKEKGCLNQNFGRWCLDHKPCDAANCFKECAIVRTDPGRARRQAHCQDRMFYSIDTQISGCLT